MVGIRYIYGYLIIYILLNHLRWLVNSVDTNSVLIKSNGRDSSKSISDQSSTPPTLVELDLTKTESTNECGYEVKDDNHVFTAKTGFKFSKVKKGDHVLKDLPSPYSPKVVANYGQPGKIMLHVYKSDSEFDLLLLDDPDPSSSDTALPSGSVEVQHESEVVSEHLKLLALSDDGSSKELDGSKFKKENLVNLVNYTFPENVRCSELKYNDKTVWQYDQSKHGRFYPTNVILNTTTSFLMLESQDHYQYYFTLIRNEWKCISGYRADTTQLFSFSKLKFFTLNEYHSPVMDDETQYDKSEDGPFTIFKFKPNAKCIYVKYDGKPTWSYNYNDHEDKYPLTVVFNKELSALTVDCPPFYKYIYSFYDGNFKCIFGYKSRLSEPVYPDKLKFFNIDNGKNLVELDKSKYDLEEPDTVFKFKPDTKCICVMYGETEVWKHDANVHRNNFPTSVSFNNLNPNYLVVESSRGYTNTFQFENSEWKLLGDNHQLKSSSSVNDKFDPDKLTFFTVDSNDTSKLVQIDYNGYTRESPSFTSYKFKSGSLCTEITYDSVPVWKYNENEHGDDFPTTVLLNIKKSYIVVESSYLYRYVYSYYDKNWKELPFGYKTSNISFDKFKLLTQDPKDDEKLVEIDSSQYDMEYSPNVLAIKFNNNVKCTSIKYEDKFPWTYDMKEHKYRYPTAVIFNKSKSFLMVESSHFYRYSYVYQNKEWKQLPYGYTLRSRSSSSSTYDINKLKLLTYDKLNDNNRVEMTTNEYDKEVSDTLVRYNMNYLTNCTCLMYDNKVVWEHNTDEHGDKYPTTISLVKKRNYLMVESGYDYRYVYEFENREWKLLPLSYKLKRQVNSVDSMKFKLLKFEGANVVELTTSEYEKEDSYNSLVFKIKKGVKCTFVKYDDIDAWKHDSNEHEDFYPTRVVFTRNKNFLLVESGYDYRYLYTFQNCEWKQMPFGNRLKSAKSYKFDFNKLKLLSTDLSNRNFELDDTKYDKVESGNIVTYTFKPNVHCTEVKYDNISAWKHDYEEHENNYPTTIIFNRSNGFVMVESKERYQLYYSFYNGQWNLIYSFNSLKLRKRGSEKVKLYETNNDGSSVATTGFSEEINGPVTSYNIFYGIKCTTVKFGDVSIWNYDSVKHKEHYPTCVVYDTKDSVISVISDKYAHFERLSDGGWTPYGCFRSETDVPSDIKLFKLDTSGNQVELERSMYSVDWENDDDVCKFNDQVECSDITLDDKSVWKHKTNQPYPQSMTYNSKSNTFLIKFASYSINCTFEGNEWKQSRASEDGSEAGEPSKAPEPAQPKESKTELGSVPEAKHTPPSPVQAPATSETKEGSDTATVTSPAATTSTAPVSEPAVTQPTATPAPANVSETNTTAPVTPASTPKVAQPTGSGKTYFSVTQFAFDRSRGMLR